MKFQPPASPTAASSCPAQATPLPPFPCGPEGSAWAGAPCPSHYPSQWPRARKRTEGSLTGFSDVDMPLGDSTGGNKPSQASHGPGSLPEISQGGVTRRELTQVPLAAGGSISWLLGLGLGVVCCPSGPAVPNQDRRAEARMQQKDSFLLRSCPHRPQAPVLGLDSLLRNPRQGGDSAETQQIV